MQVETQIIIAQEQCYCAAAQAAELLALAAEVGRLLNNLSNSLKRKLHPRMAGH